MNFLSLSIQCVALSFILAALYKLTKSIFAVVFLHVWSNLLGGMFTIDTLKIRPKTANDLTYDFTHKRAGTLKQANRYFKIVLEYEIEKMLI